MIVLLALSIVLVRIYTAEVIETSNIDAQHLVLYDSTGSNMGDVQFNITFNVSFTSTPSLAYGMNNIKMNDRFLHQNFTTAQAGITQTYFLLNTNSVGYTTILLFSISYIAIVDEPAFHIAYQLVSNAANLTSGTGQRYHLIIMTNKTFSNLSVTSLTLLTGYYLTSNTDFRVTVNAGIVDLSTQYLNFSTYSDCRLHIVSAYAVYYDTDALTSKDYYYLGGPNYIASSNASINSFDITVAYKINAKILMGLSSYGSPSSTGGYIWGWTSTVIANTTMTLTVLKTSLAFISFSYLQIGMYQIIQTVPEAEAGSNIGVIAGVVIVIIVTIIIVVVACKKCKKQQNQISPIAKRDLFRELLSLSM